MTKPTDDVLNTTDIPATNTSEVAAAQPGATACASIGRMAALLAQPSGLQGRLLLNRLPGQQRLARGEFFRVRAEPVRAGSPSRRAMLAMLVGSGVVRSRPTQAKAAVPTVEVDAGVVALAARTEVQADAFRTAVAMLIAADTRLDELALTRPTLPSLGNTKDGADPTDDAAGARRINRIADAVGSASTGLAAAFSRRRAALRKYDRTSRSLGTAAVALARQDASSVKGAEAKARACAAVFTAYGNSDPEWLSELVLSTLHDVIRTGGGA